VRRVLGWCCAAIGVLCLALGFWNLTTPGDHPLLDRYIPFVETFVFGLLTASQFVIIRDLKRRDARIQGDQRH